MNSQDGLQQLRDQAIELFIAQDFEQMQLALQELVRQNDPWGMHYLAGTLSQGIGIEINQERANELYLKAAELGFADSQAIIGNNLCGGIGCTANALTGRAWLEKASKQNHEYADFLLSRIYLNGLGVAKDIVLGIKYLEKSANSGYSEAQRILGSMKITGELTAKNVCEGLALFKLASEQSNDEATYGLGKLYENGVHVEKDMALAARYLETAANNGHVRAMHDIGTMYYNGTGIERNLSVANTWYLKAVSRGSYLSAYCLGLNAERGENEQNRPAIPLAIVWYLIAIAQSDGSDQSPANQIKKLEAVLNDSDLETVLNMLKSMADERKFPWAQLALGEMYLNGQFVNASSFTAKKYFTSAAESGLEKAAQRLRNISF